MTSHDRSPESKITRRSLLKAGAAGAAAVSMVHSGVAAANDSDRPNILFLMSDQHRGDCLGCDGNSTISTPNLDRLAAEGGRFRSAYTSVPSCTPARAGILTGLSPWHHGMLGYNRVAQSYPREMPKMIKAAGYRTLGIGNRSGSGDDQ